MVISLIHHKKTAINYPFVYRIFSRCAKGIVIFYYDCIFVTVISSYSHFFFLKNHRHPTTIAALISMTIG